MLLLGFETNEHPESDEHRACQLISRELTRTDLSSDETQGLSSDETQGTVRATNSIKRLEVVAYVVHCYGGV